MSSPPVTAKPPPPKVVPFPGLAALLSFVVPGLGQIAQGLKAKDFARLSKGCFFLLAIWGMFFYGYAGSQWRNVYLPHVQEVFIAKDQKLGRVNKSYAPFGKPLPPLLGNLWQRPQYVMQFFAGAPAWPALWNYCFPESSLFGDYQSSPGSLRKDDLAGFEESSRREADWAKFEAEDNRLQQLESMGRMWDIYWIYTVVAGALNILVIYDAFAGPVRFKIAEKKKKKGDKK